jgi:hypothetical protein
MHVLNRKLSEIRGLIDASKFQEFGKQTDCEETSGLIRIYRHKVKDRDLSERIITILEAKAGS